MSLLDSLGDLFDGDDKPGDAKGQGGLVGMAQELLGQKGGMSGLVASFAAGGLGAKVQSWLGDGANESLSEDELKASLGEDTIRQAAEKNGVDPDTASAQLSAFLPGLMDKLSIGGVLKGDDDVMGQVSGLLGRLMK